MGLKVYKKLGVLVALLFSIWGIGFALNSVLTEIFPISPMISEKFLNSPPSNKILDIKEQLQDTLIQRDNARILNPSDIVIPIRVGFPFCETFIGTDLRENIVLGGNAAADIQLTGNSLQLTGISNDESGYMFVDIPFSSKFGLKVSFEFSNYGGTGADGVSFFMFDGSIDAAGFQIGGTGGALGYTSVRATGNEATLISPGLRGAYLGIGFDELGNFGNSRTGKYGGFEDPLNNDLLSNTPLFPHSVVVRGPVDGPPPFAPTTPFRDWDRINSHIWNPGTITNPRFDSYKFIDGRIFDPASTGIAGTFPPVSVAQYLHTEKFEIDTDSFSGSCPDEGFRKVFLDLNPVDVNDPTQGYTIEIQMLVNVGGVIKLVNVFDGPINYPFAAPELLKVGFAASTGLQTNYHQIRNVTVQVSNQNALEKPVVEPLNEEVCEGETNTFDLDVELRNDAANAFIRCLQLYYTQQEAFDVVAASGTSIPFPPAGDVNSLCPTGNCIDLLCRPERTARPAYDNITGELAGEFQVLLVDEGGVEVPKVRFIPRSGYSGVTTIYYTATDNFGQVSDPKPITIIINPQPNPIITTLDPLVWEQQEVGNVRVLLESSETNPAYSYQWIRNGVEIPGATNTSYLATQAGDYAVEVTTTLGCIGIAQESVIINIVPNLDPDFQNTPLPETCADLGIIRVKLNNLGVIGVASDGSLGNEKWRILDAAGNIVIDWTFLTPGQSEIVQGDLVAGDYIFQLGDEFRSGQNGSDGLPLFRHQIPFTILPIQSPLQITGISVSPELCFGEGGIVEVTASGGEGPASYTFNLTNTANGQVFVPTSISGGTAVFENVLQGNYDALVTSATRCSLTQPLTVTGPASPLTLIFVDSDGTSCGITNNGFITWQAGGGTAPYAFVNLSRNGATVSNPAFNQNPNQDFQFTQLSTGQYVLTVKDANGCEISSPLVDLIELPNPVFEVNDLIVCEGEVAIVQPQIIELSNSQPIFTWTTPQGSVLTGNATIGGVTYTFQDDGDPQTPLALQISGLSAGTYEYLLSISGTNICTQPDQKVEIMVSPEPVIEKVDISNLTCFQSGDGSLEVLMVSGLDPSDYTYELLGYTGPQDSNLFENLLAGTYQIRIVDKVSSCNTVVADLVITEPPVLELINVVQINPSCGEENGSISLTIQGGNPGYTVQINTAPIDDFDFSKTGENYIVKNLAPGDYNILVNDMEACVSTGIVTLINDPLDPITFNQLDRQICVGNTAIIAPGIITSGAYQIRWFKDAATTQEIVTGQTDANGVSYQITSGTGSLSIIGLQENSASQYFMEVSGPQICTIVELAKVEVLPGITADVDVTPVTCFGDTDGTLIITPSGGNGFFEVSINGSPFSSALTYANLPSGNYTVEIRNDISCSFSINVPIESPTAPITINQPTIERSSCDLNNGSIRDLVISGGWETYQVEWRKGSVNGNLVAGTVSQALDLAPDTYYLIIKDTEGCEEVFDFVVGESSDPVYLLVAPINTCTGGPVIVRPVHLAPDPSLPPAAATEVRWYTGTGQIGLIQNGSDPTNSAITYTIDDTDWLNPELVIEGLPAGNHDFYFYVVCTGQELKVDITVFESPTVLVDSDPLVCFGDTNGKIRISNDLPAYSYSLNSGALTTKAALEALNFTAGNYTLVVNTPAGSCPQTISFEIEGPTGPLASSPLTKIDPGCGAPNGKLELTVTGGWMPYTLEVFKDGVSQGIQNSSQSTIVLNGYRPGTYYIVVTDKEGCMVTTNSVVLVDGPTQILVDKGEICFGESAVLSPKLDPLAPGAVFEWFFDAAKTQPIVSSATPAANGVIYQINPANGQLTISDLPSASVDYSFFVTASGSGVCPGFTGTGLVKVHEIPTATSQVINEVCFGEGGSITVNASGGSGSYTYSLNGGSFVASNLFKVPTGTHSIEVKTLEGCSFILNNIQVTGPSEPLLVENIEEDSPSCDLDNGEIRFNVKGGYEPYTIRAIQNGNLIQTLQLPIAGLLTIQNLGEGTYNFELTDVQGCVYIVPGNLELVEVPSVISITDEVICEGETAFLVPSLPQNISNPAYTWSFDAAGNNQIAPGMVVNNVEFNLAPNGELRIEGLPAASTPYTYYIMATGTGICGISPAPVKVTVNGIPNLRVSNPSIVCDPLGIVDLTDYIEGFNPTVYDYNVVSPTGVAMRLDEIDHVNFSGDYRVSSSLKGTGCWNSAQRIRVLIAEIELIANFEYQFDLGDGVLSPNTIVQIQEDVFFQDLSLGNILVWNWDFGDGNASGEQNPVHQFQEKGSYTVTLTAIDSIGCISTYQTVITVNADYNIMIPNAFTPDGFKNQYFKPYYRGIASMEFYIFNTWGELIYKAESFEDLGWDGYHNRVPAINGNYVYRGIFMTRGGDKVEKSGVFVLIR